MKKKRILIVSGSFYPELSPRAYRTTELAEELSRQGHSVTVFIPFNDIDYSSYVKEHNIMMRNIGELVFKDIQLKGNVIELGIRRIVRRGLKMLFEFPDVELMFKISKVLRHESCYDIMISIAVPYPVHWGVALTKRKNLNISECWIADCGDPYMGDTSDSFRKLFYFKLIEKWFCRKADFITVPFEGAKMAYYPEFREKIKVIPQGFNLNNFALPEYKKKFIYPVFAYAGGFIPGKRDPRSLLKFLSKYQKEYKFIVFTSHVEILDNAKKILGDKLEIRSLIPRKELLFELSGMDFLINFDNNVATQLPSKLIDYSITGRPVLNIIENDSFSVLVQFLEKDYSNQMKLENPENFDIKKIAAKFINLFEGIR